MQLYTVRLQGIWLIFISRLTQRPSWAGKITEKNWKHFYSIWNHIFLSIIFIYWNILRNWTQLLEFIIFINSIRKANTKKIINFIETEQNTINNIIDM